MPRTDTLAASSLGSALTSTGATSTELHLGNFDDRATAACIVIVATSVTSGATLLVERKPSAGVAWEAVAQVTITANGSYGVPLNVRSSIGGAGRGLARVRVLSRTDGSYVPSLNKVTFA